MCDPPRTRGSVASGARRSSSVLTDSAAASRGRWSSASRRLPDSSLLNVDTSMLDRPATSSSVSPCCMRSSRSRRRTRTSTLSCPFASMAKELGSLAWRLQARGMNTAKEHWEQHYGERDRVWSGRVNVRLVEVVSTLEAGRELDHHHEFPSGEEVVGSLDLDGDEWERVRVESVERQATGPDGQTATWVDNVIVLRRRGGD